MNDRKLRIAFLKNPDPVFYSELDDKLQEHLTKLGAEVTSFQLEELAIKISTGGKFKFFLGNNEFEFDALLNYGYMSSFHDQAYSFILTALENSGKFYLHNSEVLRVLNNKLLQACYYSRGGVSIPDTFAAFSIPSIKNVMNNNFEKNESSIIKRLNDYAGDGVKKCTYTDVAVNSFAKMFWSNEYSIIQKMVPDSIGKSIRVLIIDGKGFAVAEYQDQTGDFRSNISFYKQFKLENLTNTPRAQVYIEIAEKASKSIGDLVIGGVDILDSKDLGPVVLEINSYPDLYDIQASTGLEIFGEFTKTFYNRALNHCFGQK